MWRRVFGAAALICAAQFLHVSLGAAQQGPSCPADFIENQTLAAKLKADLKRKLASQGVPPRLQNLVDGIPNCRGCIEKADTQLVLLIEYSADEFNRIYGRGGPPFAAHHDTGDGRTVVQFDWSPDDELRVRRDLREGRILRFHIVFGAQPCRCCPNTAEGARAWRNTGGAFARSQPGVDRRLRAVVTPENAISVRGPQDLGDDPRDLTELDPSLTKEATRPPRRPLRYRGPAVMRIAQARCPSCRPLAAQRNAAAEAFNDLRQRHMELDLRGGQLYRDYVDAAQEVERIKQLAFTGPGDRFDRDRQLDRKVAALLNAANRAIAEARKIEDQMKGKRAEVEKLDAELLACDRKECQPPQTARTTAPPTPPRTPEPPRLPGTNVAAVIFEAGSLNVSSGNSTISTANCPGCPGSGSQNVSPSGNFAGADLRLNLFALVAALNLAPVPFTENLIMTGPFAGFRLRRYFNYRGDVIAFDFHGGDGMNDTSMEFELFWSLKSYLGLGFILLNPFQAGEIAALGISPYVGINSERCRIKLTADESCCPPGVNNVFEKELTRHGTAFGLDLDFYFRNLPFFVGLGLQWDRMPETSIDARTSTFGFAYRGLIPGRTSFTTAVRFGIPLGGPIGVPVGGLSAVSDIRLKRDIALIERRADGIGLYRYRYLWSDTEYVGVMAQEVERAAPETVVRGPDGFLRVRYDKLGLAMTTWDEWQATRTAAQTAP